MGTQVIRHNSRDYDITLNFESTENNLSWSFTQEGDGEVYDVVLTNVASYTVAGSAITLPYAVTNGSSYAVTIVKTTNGQTASITFKTRRSSNKSASLSVPDFGQYTGRYLYLLKSNNIIEKYDSSLFTASNYVGAGVWTTSPLISTITLPTNPDGSIYQSMCFTKYGGEDRLCCFARIATNGTTACYAVYVRLSDESVWDLAMSTQNTPTNITTYVLHTSVINANYDYINEQIILNFTGATKYAYLLNLTTNIATINTVYDADLPTVKSTNYIIPASNQLSSIGLRSTVDYKTKSYIQGTGGSNSGWAYSANLNRVITGSSNYNYQFVSWTLDGATTSTYNVTNGVTSVGSVLTKLFNNLNNVYFGLYTNTGKISWYQIGTGNNQNYLATELASGQTGFYNACFTKYNNNVFAIGNTSLGRRRITVFELDITNQTTTEMYIDFADADGNQICCNQLFY